MLVEEEKAIYAYIDGDDGVQYALSENEYPNVENASDIIQQEKRISFVIDDQQKRGRMYTLKMFCLLTKCKISSQLTVRIVGRHLIKVTIVLPQDFNLSDNSYPSHHSVNIDEIALWTLHGFSPSCRFSCTRRDVGYRLRCESKFGYASKVRWAKLFGDYECRFSLC